MSDAEERRIVAAAYITEEESAWLDARAKKLGTSRSAVLRSFITKATRRKRHHKEYPRIAATDPSTSGGMVPKAAEVQHTQTEGPSGLVCVKAGRLVPKKRPSARAKP